MIDGSRGDEPWLVITGDSLLIGDAARPDLASEAVEGATGLYGSLQRLLELPDGVELFPGHVAGSLCGAGMSSKASSTIGFERRFNHALNVDQDEFVQERDQLLDAAAAEHGQHRRAQPRAVPRRAAAARDGRLARRRLGARRAPTRASSSPATSTARSTCRSRARSFATKAAFVLTADEPVAIYAESAEDAETAAQGLRSVGLFKLRGYLPHADATEKIEPIDIDELEELLANGPVEILDVREKNERDEGYIDGTRHMPYRIVRAFLEDLPDDRPIVTICSSGSRASIAASVIASAGDEGAPGARRRDPGVGRAGRQHGAVPPLWQLSSARSSRRTRRSPSPRMRALRPHYDERGEVRRARRRACSAAEGYRLVGAFEDGTPHALAVAGFRVGHMLARGRYLYVDDLSTLPEARRRGYGRQLLDWLADEARRLGCERLHLDSGGPGRPHRRAPPLLQQPGSPSSVVPLRATALAGFGQERFAFAHVRGRARGAPERERPFQLGVGLCAPAFADEELGSPQACERLFGPDAHPAIDVCSCPWIARDIRQRGFPPGRRRSFVRKPSRNGSSPPIRGSTKAASAIQSLSLQRGQA